MSFAEVLERIQKFENPYPGLRPFERHESHLFFGRDEHIADLVRRLEQQRFVAVVGVSGSGKSSLVRAGLIPALERGYIQDAGRRWRIIITRPAGAPLDHLERDLVDAGLDPQPIRASSSGLIEVARQLDADESLLIVVDQFEEVFRYKETIRHNFEKASAREALAAETAEFVHLLLASSDSRPPVYVVLTMRSDYLGHCAEFRDLPEKLNECQYLVPRLTRDQRKQAIEAPLGRVSISANLVQRILNDAGDEPDQLPILQHALMRTWQVAHQDGDVAIALKHYELAGGFERALDWHGQQLLEKVPQDVAKVVFARLAARSATERERRDPATLAELWAICSAVTPPEKARVTEVVDHFRRGDASFLVPRDGVIGPNDYIDVAHEILIRQWAILRDEWLPDEHRAAKTFLTLIDRASNWASRPGELLRGLDLGDAVRWRQSGNRSEAWAAHYANPSHLRLVLDYVAASETAERIRARREKLKKTLLAFGIVAVAFGGMLVRRGFAELSGQRDSLRLANQAREALWSDPALALRSALEASRRAETRESRDASAAVLKESNLLAVWRVRGTSDLMGQVTAAGFSYDMERILVSTSWGTALIWNWRGCNQTRTDVYPMLRLRAAAIDKAGTVILEKASQPDPRSRLSRYEFVLWSSITNTTGPAIDSRSRGPITTVAFSPTGEYFASAGYDFRVRVWKVAGNSARLLNTLEPDPSGHRDVVNSVRFGPTDDVVITAGQDGRSKIWNWQRNTVETLQAKTLGLFDAAFDGPDPTVIATAGQERRIFIWTANSTASNKTRTEPAHTIFVNSEVNQLSFSPTNRHHLLIGTADGLARLLDLRAKDAGQPVRIFHGHRGAVTAANFSSDGTMIVTGSLDGTVRVWANADPGSTLQPREVHVCVEPEPHVTSRH